VQTKDLAARDVQNILAFERKKHDIVAKKQVLNASFQALRANGQRLAHGAVSAFLHLAMRLILQHGLA
jgi:hypothetical protein